MRKRKLQIRETPEFLRNRAQRNAPRISQFGWRPTKDDLAQLRAATGDPVAYRIAAKSWRAAGFKIRAIRKLAGRVSQRAKAPVPLAP